MSEIRLNMKWDDYYSEHKDSVLPWDGDLADFFELFLKIIPPVAPILKVLDIGCGYGEKSFWWAKKGFQVMAFDISTVAIDVAKTKYFHKNINYFVADGSDLGEIKELKNQNFDLVLDICATHFFQNQKVFVNSLKTVLSKNSFYISQRFGSEIGRLPDKEIKKLSALELINLYKDLTLIYYTRKNIDDKTVDRAFFQNS